MLIKTDYLLRISISVFKTNNDAYMMQKISYQQALDLVLSVPTCASKHTVPLEKATGKILAESLYARFDVPIAPVSAMDGYAVRSADTASASKTNPITLTACERVNTGNVVRSEFDAVIMIEDIICNESSITITAPIQKGRNVRQTGEDIKKGGLILPAGSHIRPFDIGALANYGYTEIPVRCLSVGIIPTGTELIDPGVIPKPGQVVESNSSMIAAFIESFGAIATRYPAVPDDRDAIKTALGKAVQEQDIVLLSAGSSMGSKDYTGSAIEELGDLKFHGVFMKPAKPVMMGVINEKPVLGLPGFPLAVVTGLRVFVRPLLEKIGYTGAGHRNIHAIAGNTVDTEEAIDELRFGAVGIVNGRYVALPMIRSASAQMNGIRSNCYLQIPRGYPTVHTGEPILAVADATPEDLEKTILIGGEHTSGLDTLIEKISDMGMQVRIGTGNPQTLLDETYAHGICTRTKLETDAIGFQLSDGSYLYIPKGMHDYHAAILQQIAEMQ